MAVVVYEKSCWCVCRTGEDRYLSRSTQAHRQSTNPHPRSDTHPEGDQVNYDEQGMLKPMSDREVAHTAKKWTAFTVLAIIALSLIGWQVGWWFKAENTDRQVNIDNRNKGTQTAWHDEAIKTIADFELVDPANTAARGALRNKACGLIPRLTDSYRDESIVTFYNEECK